eukprot:CAMPEP_0118952706 /NCGR_PEP_ID=MMETSP1169-20130426/55321_1 /TAXON_ID=36882 /ORGANISM="Pyramimonas obovata, Strain CCMP722" /LENGTH=283 /DNA_ID=CAMNT_0006900023 /DNA_START=206 /DNA_END=1054 /DNA_ORIENTATION=-
MSDARDDTPESPGAGIRGEDGCDSISPVLLMSTNSEAVERTANELDELSLSRRATFSPEPSRIPSSPRPTSAPSGGRRIRLPSCLASQVDVPTVGTTGSWRATSAVNRSLNSSPLTSYRPASASPRTYKGLGQSSAGLESRMRSSLSANPSSPSTPLPHQSKSMAEVRAKFLEAQASTPRSPRIIPPITWDDDGLREVFMRLDANALKAACGVCRDWRRVAFSFESDGLWSRIYKQSYPNLVIENNTTGIMFEGMKPTRVSMGEPPLPEGLASWQQAAMARGR